MDKTPSAEWVCADNADMVCLSCAEMHHNDATDAKRIHANRRTKVLAHSLLQPAVLRHAPICASISYALADVRHSHNKQASTVHTVTAASLMSPTHAYPPARCAHRAV